MADVLSCWDAFGFSYAWTQRISGEKNDQGLPALCHFALPAAIHHMLHASLWAVSHKIWKSNNTHFVADTGGPPHEMPKNLFFCVSLSRASISPSLSLSHLYHCLDLCLPMDVVVLLSSTTASSKYTHNTCRCSFLCLYLWSLFRQSLLIFIRARLWASVNCGQGPPTVFARS